MRPPDGQYINYVAPTTTIQVAHPCSRDLDGEETQTYSPCAPLPLCSNTLCTNPAIELLLSRPSHAMNNEWKSFLIVLRLLALQG